MKFRLYILAHGGFPAPTTAEPRSPGRLDTGVDAEPGHPDEIVAAENSGRRSRCHGRHARFLEQVFQRAARALRVGLQALAARAQPHAPTPFSARDRCLRPRSAKSPAPPPERGNSQLRLAMPRDRAKEHLASIVQRHFAAVQPQPARRRARSACARPPPAELLQHLSSFASLGARRPFALAG